MAESFSVRSSDAPGARIRPQWLTLLSCGALHSPAPSLTERTELPVQFREVDEPDDGPAYQSPEHLDHLRHWRAYHRA